MQYLYFSGSRSISDCLSLTSSHRVCSGAPWFHIPAPQGQQAPHTIDNCANLEMYISTRSGHQAHTENVSNLILVAQLVNLIWLLHLVERLKCWVVVTRRRQVYYQSFYPFIAAFLHLSRINTLTVKRGVSVDITTFDDVFVSVNFPRLGWLVWIDWLILMGWECWGVSVAVVRSALLNRLVDPLSVF